MADDPFTADASLSQLMAMGLLDCPECESDKVLLASNGDARNGGHLLLYKRLHPVGELAAEKNVSIEGSDKTLFIPYGTDERSSERRAPFMDTKTQPDLMHTLPEIVAADTASATFGGDRGFQTLLEQINRHPSFASLACGWESATHEGKILTYGYVDMAAVPIESNDYERARNLADMLMSDLSADAVRDVRYILALKLGIFQLRPVFFLDIETIASAKTERSSFKRWESALKRLAEAISRLT